MPLITRSSPLSEWALSDPGKQGAFAVEATTRWGTKRADAIDILQASLRGVPITVYDVITVGDQEKRVLNPAETVAAQEKQQEIARLTRQMKEAAKMLEFEIAAQLRDQIKALENG